MTDPEDTAELALGRARLAEERRRNRRVAQALIALGAVGALVSFNIWYTADAIRRSDARWCELMTGLDARYQAIENPSPDAVKFRDQVHRFTQGLPCQ